MSEHTTSRQREFFYQRHQSGETYAEIAGQMGVSRECVRYWCRRQRDGKGISSIYHREPCGLLSRFEPVVRFVILRLRLKHPRWGPDRIRHAAKQRQALRGLRLPSIAQMGRYLHQWERFRRRPVQRIQRQRPSQSERVHQCWQMDFKMGIVLQNGRQVNLYTVRDPFGAACIGADVVLPSGIPCQSVSRPTIKLVWRLPDNPTTFPPSLPCGWLDWGLSMSLFAQDIPPIMQK